MSPSGKGARARERTTIAASVVTWVALLATPVALARCTVFNGLVADAPDAGGLDAPPDLPGALVAAEVALKLCTLAATCSSYRTALASGAGIAISEASFSGCVHALTLAEPASRPGRAQRATNLEDCAASVGCAPRAACGSVLVVDASAPACASGSGCSADGTQLVDCAAKQVARCAAPPWIGAICSGDATRPCLVDARCRESKCIGSALSECANEGSAQIACDVLGLRCDESGAQPTCAGDDETRGCTEVGATRCDGSVLEVCSGRFAVRRDCAAEGLACIASGDGAACAPSGASCSPLEISATECVDDMRIRLCLRGALATARCPRGAHCEAASAGRSARCAF